MVWGWWWDGGSACFMYGLPELGRGLNLVAHLDSLQTLDTCHPVSSAYQNYLPLQLGTTGAGEQRERQTERARETERWREKESERDGEGIAERE